MIENQFENLGPHLNRFLLADGTKKDVVICNKIAEYPDKVAIYGWCRPNGTPIQPLYTDHVNWYVDYSQGIRLINRLVYIDGKPDYIDNVLRDPSRFGMFSNEANPMNTTKYYLHDD